MKETPLDLDGKTALVTGGGKGIGLAISQALAAMGAKVVINYRSDKAAAESAASSIHGATAHQADVSEPAQVEAMVKAIGRVDVLVNNAGVGLGAPLKEIQTKHLDRQLAVNLRSIVILYRECLSMLETAASEHRNALVVNTASIAGKFGQAWTSVYSATKHGVVGWTEAMNKELSPQGIKSTALCPAFVDTPMTDFVKEHVPGEEMIRPADIAEGVRFLLKVSPACIVPEMMFIRPGDSL